MSTTTNWDTALISGGGSGIGLRVAEMLRAQGTAVAIVDLRIGERARARLAAGDGPTVSLHEADVSDG
ncbi:MAG: hypothetical protein KJ006_11295, partial [Thermoleophilia bacterium]|nr:hypothetical protein [Thermoleophilia bacterium]